jgi:NADH-quinone oxidoreductase subunit L
MIFARGSVLRGIYHGCYFPIILLLTLPFFTGISQIVSTKKTGRAMDMYETWLSSAILFACGMFTSLSNVGEGGYEATARMDAFEWMNLSGLSISFTVCVDSTNQVMIFVVTSVSWLVQLYAHTYMKHDPALVKFKGFLLLFTFFMLVLIVSDNLLQVFFGWEGVGICSYFLINFWYNRIQANKAAIKAVMVNRVGDTALAMGIFLLYCLTGEINIKSINAALIDILADNPIQCSSEGHVVPDLLHTEINFIVLLIFIGCMGKSAQIGLHTWLPDAMEGPTPVSALLHAATMVTAGIYLMIKLSFLFSIAKVILPIIVIVGATTAFHSASVALVQNDLKRVIAFSTCSQLGYMTLACGLGSFEGALYHLYNHAFFKALLFLTAGIIIHGLSNEQDIRKMGGLINFLPFSYIMMVIGSLALGGFPFLAGYYSKELILEQALVSRTIPAIYGYTLATAAAGLTSFYSARSIILIFFGKTNLDRVTMDKVHDAPKGMIVSVSILAFLSITSGYMSQDYFVGLGNFSFSDSISSITNKSHYNAVDAEFLSYRTKIIPVISSVCGFLAAILYYLYIRPRNFDIDTRIYYRLNQEPGFYAIHRFLSRRWFFDTIYNDIIFKIFNNLYTTFYESIEKGIYEQTAISGLSRQTRNKSNVLKNLQQGNPYTYLVSILFGTIASILILIGFTFGLYVPFIIALIIVSIRVHLL